jgi:peptidyl-prolyl cis-trans isomerase A (cyclophilin A)
MRRALIPILTAVIVALAPGLARADSGEIVRFETSLGNIDVQLLPQDAPNTVANFLSYVNSGAYAQTFFHRSTSSASDGLSVIQGGGYYVNNGSINTIAQNSPVANEYDLPNTPGTLAMAKLSSGPDTATDQWFFNVSDNSSTLGPGNNGGFTVFGKVLDPASLNVMNAISALPVADESGSPTFGSAFNELPYTGQSATIQTLVMSPITVLNDTTAPVITITEPTSGEEFADGQTVTPQFSCNDGTGTGVASCTPSPIDTSTFGQETFTVTTTDYAGNTSTQSVKYQVDPPSSPPVRKPSPAPPKPSPPTLKGSLTTTTSGHLTFKLACAGGSRCQGQAKLYAAGASTRGKRIALASGHYSIAAHTQAKLSLRAKRSALSLLHRSKGHLRVALVVAATGGTTRTITTQLTFARA